MSASDSHKRLDICKHARKLISLVLLFTLALAGCTWISVITPPAAQAAPSVAPGLNGGVGQAGAYGGKKFAVLVAIEAYPWFPGPLKYCLEDLQDMKEVLIKNCGFKQANIFELKDASATRAKLKDVILNRLDPREGPKDTVVFFFSGHGWPSIFGSGEGLYLSDGIMFDSQFDNLLSNLETRKLVVLLDSCFSGGFAGGGATKGVQGVSGLPGSSPSVSLAQKLSGEGRVVLTACKAMEQSDEYPDLQNGLFTYYLCEALKSRVADTDSNRHIDTNEAYNYLGPLVLQYSQNAHSLNHNRPVQHPQIYSGIPGGLELSKLSRDRF